jgi:hypothetical protein
MQVRNPEKPGRKTKKPPGRALKLLPDGNEKGLLGGGMCWKQSIT